MLVLEGFYYNSWLQLLTQTHHIIHFCQERANGCIWCISIKDDKRIKKVYSLSIRHCTNTYGKVKLPDLQRSADLLSADGPCVVPPRSWDPEPAGICRVWKIASHKLSSILQRQGHCASPDDQALSGFNCFAPSSGLCMAIYGNE